MDDIERKGEIRIPKVVLGYDHVGKKVINECLETNKRDGRERERE
jgi:hypothetical protein